MKRYLKALIFMLACLAILIPFASKAPDGLEKVAETLGIEEHKPLWTGIMSDYTLPTIDNPYLSTLLGGVFGVFIVLGVTFLLGKAIAKK